MVLLDIGQALARHSIVVRHLSSVYSGPSCAEVQIRPGLRGGAYAAGIDRYHALCKSRDCVKLSENLTGPEGLRMYSRFVSHQP